MIPAVPPAIRIAGPFSTAFGTGDSLTAQNTRLLVDGTIAQVHDSCFQYRLSLNSVLPPSQ